MKCPVDGATLVMADRQGVEIDYCPECRGVWLDRGELDKIIERSVPRAAAAIRTAPRRHLRLLKRRGFCHKPSLDHIFRIFMKYGKEIPDRLAALGHPQRLAILRLLMRRFPDRLPAGDISRRSTSRAARCRITCPI
jgi:Zn-finger nucleic acid-binding protein